jgi:DNA-binding NarL/FixJ family response regulator
MRVTLVGDWPLVRSGFRQLLQSAGIGVIASVADAAEAANVLRRVGADVVVISAVTCQAGVTNTRKIVGMDPDMPILVLGRWGDSLAVQRILEAGARGYLGLSQVAEADLIEAVRRVAAGGQYLGPGVLMSTPSPSPLRFDTAYEKLTKRERQVLMLVAHGRSNREIAATLVLSANTVAVHRARLMKTLAVRKTADLVLIAVRHGLVMAE